MSGRAVEDGGRGLEGAVIRFHCILVAQYFNILAPKVI